jgi:dihydrofolate reductase
MFGPIRGPWRDETWKGWWGDNPPYHTPVFVLTHYARATITMDGGTTFHFVTDGILAALESATKAANGKDIRLGGGVATVQQYLRSRLVDEMHLAISPILLGAGEGIFAGINLLESGISVQGICSGRQGYACRAIPAEIVNLAKRRRLERAP